jgi:hypothetical protein
MEKPSNFYEKQTEDFMQKHGVKMQSKLSGKFSFFNEKITPRDVYQITLKKEGKTWRFNFGMSLDSSGTGSFPSAYDVLASLTKYAPREFEEFCLDFGYVQEDKLAKRMYKAVKKEWEEMEAFFGEALEELREIQ